jgi:squalene-hopene/tetraprenyl-beta-curcumene cyclase
MTAHHPPPATHHLVREAFEYARAALLARRRGRTYWEGHLATSALATATAVSAFAVVGRNGGGPRGLTPFSGPPVRPGGGRMGSDPLMPSGSAPIFAGRSLDRIRAGLAWLAANRNADGGWGDTTRSKSNLSTSVLVLAALRLASESDEKGDIPHSCKAPFGRPGAGNEQCPLFRGAERYVEAAGGVAAVVARYGADRTFSAPILTTCALAGLADGRDVPPLPFELAALPQRLFRALDLSVVSYALPALIAVGLAGFTLAPPRNVVVRFVRRLVVGPVLKRLTGLIPESGGFLEAVPLTAFVVMGLCAAGHADHPAVERGLAFLDASQRPDGGWPIDTNLSVWNTTLAVNALDGALDDAAAVREWLLARQTERRHPYTGAAPGGWGWSHLSGSVPDVDDTAGALLALTRLPDPAAASPAVAKGLRWLCAVQNRDGGWPTFCRGWQKLPFDRSAPDLTAHALRALAAWNRQKAGGSRGWGVGSRSQGGAAVDHHPPPTTHHPVRRGLAYLARTQDTAGRWFPLWFGNENAPGEGNPVLGTARVLAAYRDLGLLDDPHALRGRDYLRRAQNADGSWGGDADVPGSIEETALACEALCAFSRAGSDPSLDRGLAWLCRTILAGGMDRACPIGLYFARLWYYEDVYPLVFATSALRRALEAESEPGP